MYRNRADIYSFTCGERFAMALQIRVSKGYLVKMACAIITKNRMLKHSISGYGPRIFKI